MRITMGRRRDWYLGYVLLNLLDIFLTFLIIQLGGWETNPVGALVLSHFGWACFVIFKFVQCAVVVGIVEVLWNRRRIAARSIIALACSVYILLMFWDSYLLLQASAAGYGPFRALL